MSVEWDHDLAVTTWLERATGERSVDTLIRAFEHAFTALWRRSTLTLGEVTLFAIVERVVHTATERYPFLASVEVDSSGLHCRDLASREGLLFDQLSAAIHFVLVELLALIGNLTAQILTPALHAELSKDVVRLDLGS